MTYFDTDPRWLASIAAWASAIDDIKEVWLFGSRATGLRRSKEGGGEPDLDLAIVTFGASSGDRLGAWLSESDDWAEQVQALVPVKVDLQHCDFRCDGKVPGWVRANGVRFYSRTGGDT